MRNKKDKTIYTRILIRKAVAKCVHLAACDYLNKLNKIWDF